MNCDTTGGCSLLSVWAKNDSISFCNELIMDQSLRTTTVVQIHSVPIMASRSSLQGRSRSFISYTTVCRLSIADTLQPGVYPASTFKSSFSINYFRFKILSSQHPLLIVRNSFINTAVVQPMSITSVRSLCFWHVLVHVVPALHDSSPPVPIANNKMLGNVLRGATLSSPDVQPDHRTICLTFSYPPIWHTMKLTACSRCTSMNSSTAFCPSPSSTLLSPGHGSVWHVFVSALGVFRRWLQCTSVVCHSVSYSSFVQR